jgi:hypothetical protein
LEDFQASAQQYSNPTKVNHSISEPLFKYHWFRFYVSNVRIFILRYLLIYLRNTMMYFIYTMIIVVNIVREFYRIYYYALFVVNYISNVGIQVVVNNNDKDILKYFENFSNSVSICIRYFSIWKNAVIRLRLCLIFKQHWFLSV